MIFQDQCIRKDVDTSKFSKTMLKYCDDVCKKYHINTASFLKSEASEYTIMLRINDEIRKLFRIQFHNIGEAAFEKYYQYNDHYSWLKLEHLLIQLSTNFAQNYSKNKNKRKIKNPLSQMITSNRYLATRLGWLSEDEIDPEVISKACRKVTDNLRILKGERKSISVEQKYVHGKQGSYHLITVNWFNVINLYTNYDPKIKGTIRLRKSIKYRIISFIRNTANKYSNKLKTLMRSQRLSYLVDLSTLNVDDFQNDKYVLYKLLSRKDIQIDKKLLNTKNIVPIFSEDGHELVLRCKSESAYLHLEHNANYLVRYFENINVKLSIVAN